MALRDKITQELPAAQDAAVTMEMTRAARAAPILRRAGLPPGWAR